MIGSDSYRCDARHRVDERNEKNSQSRTRSGVSVRWFVQTAIEGQRAGFPLLRTRARACGALPSVRGTSSARQEEKVEGLGGVHFFHTTTTTMYYYYKNDGDGNNDGCLLYTSPSPRDRQKSRMPSSA